MLMVRPLKDQRKSQLQPTAQECSSERACICYGCLRLSVLPSMEDLSTFANPYKYFL